MDIDLTLEHSGNQKKFLNIDGMEILDDGSINDVSFKLTFVVFSPDPNKP